MRAPTLKGQTMIESIDKQEERAGNELLNERTGNMKEREQAEREMREAGEKLVEALGKETDKLDAACTEIEGLRDIMLDLSGRLGVERRARQKLESFMYTFLIQGMHHGQQNSEAINRILGLDSIVPEIEFHDDKDPDEPEEGIYMLEQYYAHADILNGRR